MKPIKPRTRPDKPAPKDREVPAGPETRLERIIAGGTHEIFRSVTLPRVGPVKIRLARRGEKAEIDYSIARWFKMKADELGMTVETLSAVGSLPVASRTLTETLARAVRDHEDTDKPFGTHDAWENLDDEIIGVAWAEYEGLRLELDPLSGGLPQDEFDLMVEAAKKNDKASLYGCGSPKLVAFAIALANLPSS